MTNAKESTMRRIAIVMASLPQPVAQRLLGSLSGDLQKSVRAALSTLADVDPLERRRAIDGFTRSLRSISGEGVPKSQTNSSDAAEIVFSRTALRSLNGRGNPSGRDTSEVAFVDPGINESRSEASGGEKAVPFAFLGDVDDDTLVTHLAAERPQTLAIILASISPSQAARVLPRLDLKVRVEAMRRMATLTEIPNDLLDDIGSQLRTRLYSAPRAVSANNAGAGQRALDAILAELPSESLKPAPLSSSAVSAVHSVVNASSDIVTEKHANAPEPQRTATRPSLRIADGTQREQVSLGNTQPENNNTKEDASLSPPQLRSTDSIHQFLVSIPAIQLRDALGKAPIRQSLLALCGLPNSTAEAVFASLPRKQAKQVRDQLAAFGSLELREIDEAKELVATIALSANTQTANTQSISLAAA